MSQTLLGQTLDEARKSHFFEWFHFKPVEQKVAPLPAIVAFRPEGARFHELVLLDVYVPVNGSIRQLDLVLRRAFIDTSADSPFARDIAKSLLEAAVPDADRAAVSGLIAELSAFGASGAPVIMHRFAPTADPPAETSPAYKVFLGTGAHALFEGSACQVRMMNGLRGGISTCTVSVASFAPGALES